jgi:hypothetical protein
MGGSGSWQLLKGEWISLIVSSLPAPGNKEAAGVLHPAAS